MFLMSAWPANACTSSTVAPLRIRWAQRRVLQDVRVATIRRDASFARRVAEHVRELLAGKAGALARSEEQLRTISVATFAQPHRDHRGLIEQGIRRGHERLARVY